MTTYEHMAAHVPAPGETPDWKWFLHAIPALTLLAATPQDPYYHAEGNVWIHTRMVIEALMRAPEYIDGNDGERFILFYAALLHDIAKPATTVIDPESGRIGQPGHSKRGAIDARILCWHAGVPFALREQLCRIITVHQLPFFALAGNKHGQSAEFLIRKLSHELDLRLLAAVAQAERKAISSRNGTTHGFSGDRKFLYSNERDDLYRELLAHYRKPSNQPMMSKKTLSIRSSPPHGV